MSGTAISQWQNRNKINPDQQFTSGGSALSKSGIRIDPKILNLKTEGRDLAQGALSGIQQDRAATVGDRSTFIERRTQGLREGIQQQGQALTSRLTKTGVGGEFGQQTQENFAETARQRMASGEMIAANEFTALEGNFDRLEGGATQLLANINTADFAQQLQARGMSQDLISKLTRLEQGKEGIKQQKGAQDQAMVGNLIMAGAMFLSSHTFKHEKESINKQETLDSLMSLSVEKWKYLWDEDQHIGCYAEDFNKRFGIEGSKVINVVDVIGVLMASIQAQQEQINELKGKENADIT